MSGKQVLRLRVATSDLDDVHELIAQLRRKIDNPEEVLFILQEPLPLVGT